MNIIKNKLFIMIFIFVVMIVLGAGSSYGNDLETRINNYENKGWAGLLDTKILKGSDTIWNENQNYYCVTKDQGSTNNTQSATYQVKSFFKIHNGGIDVAVWSPNSQAVVKYAWDDIKEIEEDNSTLGITRKMYYVLNSSDEYGTYFGGNISCNDGAYSISKKQGAIWLLIDDFLETYGEDDNSYSSINNKNRAVKGEARDLYNKACTEYINNKITINDPVYIWFYTTQDESIRTSGSKFFWQNLILAGKREKNSGGGGSVTPEPGPKTVQLIINKKDSVTKKLISNKVKFELRWEDPDSGNQTTTYRYSKGGVCFFNNITTKDKTVTYSIYETEIEGSGYKLDEQRGYANGKVYIGYITVNKYGISGFSYKGTRNSYTSDKLDVNIFNIPEQKGGFVLTKRDRNSENSLKDVNFYITTSTDTIGWSNYKNKCISWYKTDSYGRVTFDDLDKGTTYYIWERNARYGYNHDFLKVGKVTITETDKSNTVTIFDDYKGNKDNTVYNEKLTLELTKKEYKTGEYLEGVWFFITDDAKQEVDIKNYYNCCVTWRKTNSNSKSKGKVEFVLDRGEAKTYYLWEYNPLSGFNHDFKKIGKIDYDVSNEQWKLSGLSPYNSEEKFKKFESDCWVNAETNCIYNTHYKKLIIRKSDADNVKRNFKGIKFKIKDTSDGKWLQIQSDGKVISKTNEESLASKWEIGEDLYTSNDNFYGKTNEIIIPYGEYQIKETDLGELSDIYSLESKYVTIWNGDGTKVYKDGKIKISSSSSETEYVMVKNKQKYGQLQIRKEDLNTKEPLKDFGFKIYSPAENGWIQVKKTNNGSYQIRGYGAFADAKVFTLDSSGKVTKAEEFTTDSNGETLIIKKIPLGIYYLYETKVGKYIDEQDIYKLGKKSVPERKQEENITVDANLLLDENGKEFKKIEVKSRYNLGGKTDLTKITGYNKQAYVDLSGYVWVDKQTSKAQVRNNHWKTDNTLNDYKDDQDTRLDGIKVMLKKKDGSTVKTATTANSGTYTFEKVLITELKNYYIEFEYEGLKYANVVPYIDDDTGSKAIEGDARTAFNKNFSVIEGGENKEGVASARYGYTKDSSGNKKYDLNYTLSNYTATLNNSAAFKINANTEKSGYNIESKFSYGDSEKPKVTEIKDINLGLYEREQPDISLVQDIQNVRLSINGQSHTYNYSSRFNGVRGKDIYDAGVRFGEKVRYPILFKSNI